MELDQQVAEFAGRLDAGHSPYIGYDETQGWPDGRLDELIEKGILVETVPSKTVVCNECRHECTIEPSIETLPQTDKAVGLHLCDVQGMIEVNLDRLKQWEIVPEKLVEFGLESSCDNPENQQHEPYHLEWLGATWRIVFDDEVTTVNDGVGIQRISLLLSNPGKDLFCLDILSQEGKNPLAKFNEFEDAVIDKETESACEEKLREYEEELEDARACNDYGRIDKIEPQLEHIKEYLLKAKGYNGRTRKFGNDPEKARTRITNSIKRTISSEDIAKIPELQRHLENSINTARFMCYRPEREISWKIIKKFDVT